MCLKVAEVGQSSFGVGVSAVSKGMDKYILHLVVLGGITQALEVLDMRMHSSIGKKADKVHVLFGGFCTCKSCAQYRVAEQLSLCNGKVDFYQILVDYSSGTQVHMPYFRVAHLPFGKAYSQTGSLQFGMRIGVE